MAALAVLPAALVVYLSFTSGGFYPAATAYVAIVLCLACLLRVTLARAPLAGIDASAAITAASLGALALLVLASALWSHAPQSALTAFVTVLVYLLVLAICASQPRDDTRLALVVRLIAGGLVIVCGAGAITRLLPGLWPISPGIVNNRLSFPLTYWNSLGLIAALGIVLCTHLSSSSHERPAVRVLAAASIPLLATTLYFTFSRGGILTALVALGAYTGLGRSRLLASTALVAIPFTALALAVDYGANLLATPDPTTPAAVGQGHRVFFVLVLACSGAAIARTLALLLDRRLADTTLSGSARRHWLRWRRSVLVTTWTAIAVGVIVIGVTQYQGFVRGGTPGNAADLRTRLLDPESNGRVDMWNIAWSEFTAHPLLGGGAGSYAQRWAQARPIATQVRDAHSLYLQTLAEQGVVGALALLAVVISVLIAAARRIGGTRRSLHAAVFAVLLTWALHAGIDWDWQMPAVSVIFFALGGFALARGPRGHGRLAARGGPSLHSFTRARLGIGCLALALVPALVWLAARRLDDAQRAFTAGDCTAAISRSLASIDVLGSNPEPYEIVGFCDVRAGRPLLGAAQVREARSLDPGDWRYSFALALADAAAGLDPRPTLERALAQNPLEPILLDARERFARAGPSGWQQLGTALIAGYTRL